MASQNALPSSSDAGLSAGLWGSDEEEEQEMSSDQPDYQRPPSIDGHHHDPAADLLNIPPGDDSLSAETLFEPPPIPKRQPPTFQAAFSQSRLQHPPMSAYHQAFNSRSPNLFPSSSATRSQQAHPSHRDHHSPFDTTLHPSEPLSASTSTSLPPRTRSDSDDCEDAAARFLASFVTSQPDSPPVLDPPAGKFFDSPPGQYFNQPDYGPVRAANGRSSHQEDGMVLMANALSQLTDSLAHSPSPPALPPPDPESHSPSAPASPPHPICPPPPRPSLCLPPRPPRLVTDSRYAHTPYNSPAGSGPSTPTLASSSVAAEPAPLRRLLKTLPSSTLSGPAKRKKTAAAPAAPKQAPPAPPPRPDLSQVELWKKIEELRRKADQPEELERLEQQWDEVLRSAGTLSSALKLRKAAEHHVTQLKRMKDALGEELVRVQIEESILRHVRGIIADRQMKRQEWNETLDQQCS